MNAFIQNLPVGTLLDGLALAGSLMMVVFLLCNRRKYGRMVLAKRPRPPQTGFSDQVALQMISQQSRKAYDSLQQSLTKEFETLRLLGQGGVDGQHGRNLSLDQETSCIAEHERRRRYRTAEEMMSRGESARQIRRHCGLTEGEFELLMGLTRLARANAPKG